MMLMGMMQIGVLVGISGCYSNWVLLRALNLV